MSSVDVYENNLRVFKDVDDLFDTIDNETIFAWVNAYARLLPVYEKLEHAENKRKGYHKVYQERKKITMKAMSELLDPDELARIKKLAEARVAEKEDGDDV